MKKFIIFAVVLALLVPTMALAAAEFTLGGFIKLDTFWDSTQESKNMNLGIARNNYNVPTGIAAASTNAPGAPHGRTKFTAQGSRFNLTIKGPDLWGAKTTGYLEMDFDIAEQGATTPGVPASGVGQQTVGVNGGNYASSSNNYVPRLRHAMFRFNWPETELLFGQYWSMFSEWYPETAEDGPFQGTGVPTARLPQIRATQKFLGWGTASVLVGQPNDVSLGQTYSTFDNSGQSTATPQVQGKLQYQQDLWGKAAYYGTPIPFTAQVVAGWQRSTFAQNDNTWSGTTVLRTFGQNTYSPALINVYTQHQTLDPWLLMGTVFAPVIPTHSANLAGTASLLANWWVGQGVEAFGFTGATNFFRFTGNNRGMNKYDVQLQQRFGGEVQGQYYFTNQWFITAAYGLSKTFNMSQADTSRAATLAQGTNNPNGYIYAFAGDFLRTWTQAEVCLWYRPIQAIKFGLQYAYGSNQYMQITGGGTNIGTNSLGSTPFGNYTNPANTSQNGMAHRVEFVGFFYF